MIRTGLWIGLWMLCLVVLGACSRNVAAIEKHVPGGDATLGVQAIGRYGCGSCHNIPGVTGANAFVGPPLDRFSQRHYIAGNMPNNVDNLIEWIQYPQSIEPGTAMPNLDVTEEDARNIAAYLYTLR
jgi:cytochrome c